MPEENAPSVPEGYFTAEQLAEQIKAAREEERTKLAPKIDQQKSQYDTMQAELAELKKAEAARVKAAEKAAADAEKARQAKADAEKSAKELLEQRNQEWQARFDAERQAQEARLAEIAQQQQVQQALWEKEREMTALAIYTRDAVAANQDNIAPELVDLIGGSTKEEVDASIQDMIARTGRIVEGMRQAQQAHRAGMPGTAPSAGATAVVPGIDTGEQKLTPEDIQGMSMKDFAALRQKMGLSATGGRGIFG